MFSTFWFAKYSLSIITRGHYRFLNCHVEMRWFSAQKGKMFLVRLPAGTTGSFWVDVGVTRCRETDTLRITGDLNNPRVHIRLFPKRSSWAATFPRAHNLRSVGWIVITIAPHGGRPSPTFGQPPTQKLILVRPLYQPRLLQWILPFQTPLLDCSWLELRTFDGSGTQNTFNR